MVEVDNERLTQLIEACKYEYPDIDPYIIWVYRFIYNLGLPCVYMYFTFFNLFIDYMYFTLFLPCLT